MASDDPRLPLSDWGTGENRQLLWRIHAGLRLLSYVNPEYAEAQYAVGCDHRWMWQSLIQAGKLSPSDPHNLLIHNLEGRIQYHTFYPDGRARTWADGYPEEAQKFLRIELDQTLNKKKTIADTIIGSARSLSSGLGKQIEAIVANLQLPAPFRMIDPGFRQAGGNSGFPASLETFRAIASIEFLESMLTIHFKEVGSGRPAGSWQELNAYESNLWQRYKNFSARGAQVDVVLLLLEIYKAAQPEWPFGSLSWVCGQSSCCHPLCHENQAKILRESEPPGFHGSKFINETIYVRKLANTVLKQRNGMRWIERAAQSLLTQAEQLGDSLYEAKSNEEFYQVHHSILGRVQASLIGWQYLFDEVPEENFERARNTCDEIRARSRNALNFDFRNAVDRGHPVKFRQDLAFGTMESIKSRGELFNKWAFEERLFPPFWEDFLVGRTNELPSSQPRKER